MNSVGIHNVVRITQAARDYGSFQTVSWTVEDDAGQRNEITLYTHGPVAIEIEAPETITTMPEELQT
jgi:hypothetical protein